MAIIIIIIVLFCLSWEVVTSWRSQMVLQMHVFHLLAAILETEDTKLCTRMNIKPRSSTPLFWDVSSIWELEGGISAQRKERPQREKTSFIPQGTFLPCCFSGRFLWLPGVTESSLDSKEGFCGLCQHLNSSVVLLFPGCEHGFRGSWQGLVPPRIKWLLTSKGAEPDAQCLQSSTNKSAN